MARSALALALFGALAVVGSGFASTPARVQVDFFSAPEGSASAFSFLQHQTGLPLALRVAVVARARRIDNLRLGSRDHVLLVAPTSGSGFCTSLSGPYGGAVCTLATEGRANGGKLDPAMISANGGPILFDGDFTVADATRLEVTFQDGTTATIPFVWVGKPISAGFFLYNLTAHRRPGHRPVALALYNRQGRQLDRVRVRVPI